jgi:hypothetical protein
MKRLALFTGLVAVAVLPASALAQTPTTPTTAPVVKPSPKAAAGKVSLRVFGGQPTKKLRYVATGSRIRVEATTRPFVTGQTLVLEVSRRGKVVSRQSAALGQGKKGTGRAVFGVKTRRSGVLGLRVVHVATDKWQAFASKAVRVRALNTSAGSGARGTKVVLLQRGLRKLGYAVSLDGFFGPATERAVLAYRKTNGLGRTGFASNHVFSLVLRGRGAFRARFPKAGRHVEFDWSRQVLALLDGGRPVNVYHASSGAPATPTVFGTFRFYMKQPGTNAKGMVQSNYFIRGYAIHGYSSVPNYPASHGCIRVPIPNAYEIDRQLSIGETIFVYR